MKLIAVIQLIETNIPKTLLQPPVVSVRKINVYSLFHTESLKSGVYFIRMAHLSSGYVWRVAPGVDNADLELWRENT